MKQIFFLLMIVLTLGAAGCKKSSESKPDCYLSVITPERGSVSNFYYDDQGRLVKKKMNDLTIQYEYKGDSIIATERKTAAFSLRKRYKLNAQGLPVVMRIDINESGSQWWQFNYEYNGTELIKSVESFYGNSITTVVEYSWSNGNLAGFKNGIYTWKFEYEISKLRLPGDGFHMLLLLESNNMLLMCLNGGIDIIRNRNLLKKMEMTVQNYGTSVNTYEYGFDKDGKIENLQTLNSNGDPQSRYDYQFSCH